MELPLIPLRLGGAVYPAAPLAPAYGDKPPCEDIPFETLVDHYARESERLLSAGAKLLVADGLVTMAQCRAAVLGAHRAAPGAPVVAICPCDSEGRTAAGTDVLAAGIVLEGIRAAGFGLECSDPELAAEQLARLTPYLTLPLFLRSASDGAMHEVDRTQLPPHRQDPDVIPCASEREARFISPDADVGEVIRCGPDLLEDILEAEEQRPYGALKIAVLDEDDLDLFAQEQYAIRDALCLWSDVPELMEGALRAYQGRAFYDGTAELPPEFLAYLDERYGLIVL